jgi:hypothetical protein
VPRAERRVNAFEKASVEAAENASGAAVPQAAVDELAEFDQYTNAISAETASLRFLCALQAPRAMSPWTVFQNTSSNARVTVALFEFGSPLPQHFFCVLHNIAHVHGGRADTGLWVLVAPAEAGRVADYVSGWTHVRVIPLSVPSYEDYNELLVSEGLWAMFETEFVLVTQVDVVLFRPLDPWMLEYDYIGAPWVVDWWNGRRQSLVGNGGYSLRRVSVMLRIIREHPPQDPHMNEDVYFTEYNPRRPPDRDALQFSWETYASADCTVPTGVHKLWSFPNGFRCVKAPLAALQALVRQHTAYEKGE